MLDLYEKIEEAKEYIASKWAAQPRAGIILGTGLGPFVEQIDVAAEIDYETIPHFPSSTATSHRGRLICGELDGVPILAMEGRVHLYEGHAAKMVTLPVRVMRAMGAEWLIASNAVGGMNPNYQAGDIMAIEDHINLMTDNPLIGVNDDRLGPRFPDMSEPYDLAMVETALAIARQHDFVLHKGVLVVVTGPNLETRAEYRFLRMIGADAVGMSVVPEVITAVHCGLKVAGFSVVTDMCLPDALKPAVVEEIIATANAAEPRLRELVRGVIKKIGNA